jgi:hypothetical protein
MKTIFADYNATTEAGRLRLGFKLSQQQIAAAQLHPGDWAWLSDSEVLVGARLAVDERYGVVGDPDWDTVVHLDDDDLEIPTVEAELEKLLGDPRRSPEKDHRIFELLTVYEDRASRQGRADITAQDLSSLRAQTLLLMGKPELALVEVADARRSGHGDPDDDRLFLEILRRIDPPRAATEASALAARTDAGAAVLAKCIDVLTDYAERLPDDQLMPVADQVLRLAKRYEVAPDRDEVDAQSRALFGFNLADMLLRLGRGDEARATLRQARLAMHDWRDSPEAAGYSVLARNLADRIRATSPAA